MKYNSYFRIIALLAFVTSSGLVIASTATAVEKIEVNSAVIQVIEEVDVPSRVAGIIANTGVKEGHYVKEGDLLGSLDDTKAALVAAQAEADYRIAVSSAQSNVNVLLSETEVRNKRHEKKELEVDHKIAATEAENDVYIRVAQKAHKVAESELKRAIASREAFLKSVSQSEIDTLKLKVEKHLMEEEQAKHELHISGLRADLKQLSISGSDISVKAAELKSEEATEEQERAKLQADLQKQKRDLALVEVQHHKIVAPIDGVVAEVYQQKGEWVEPGMKVMRIVRLNRLRAEAFVSVDYLPELKRGLKVTLTVQRRTRAGEQVFQKIEGELTFVSTEVDTVDEKVAVWAEFDNPELNLRPGMRGRISILVAD